MHRISGKYPVSDIIRYFYYPLDIISKEYIRLKFELSLNESLFILSYTNVLEISMHILDIIISYILQNYNFSL